MFLNKNQTNDFDTSEKKLNFKKILIILIILAIIIAVIYYAFNKLSVKTEYYLVLKGDTDLIIKQNSDYIEAGFQAYDNHQNDLSNEVVVSGEVNPNIAGEYTITYTFNDITRTRSVLVVADDSQITYLVLNGTPSMFLKVGETYQEPGFTVIDNLQNNLTEQVKVSGNVNTQKAGTYKLTYSVTNKSGHTVTEERTIIVTDSDISLNYQPTEITNKEVTINVNVTDNYFNYLVLPNNEKVTTRTAKYTVNKNGTYKFIIHSKDGTTKAREITVDNIDNEAPTGSCQATRKNGMYLINVSAKDNKKIKEYAYYINNSLVKKHTLNYLNQTSNITNNIYVVVSDQANNTKKITCGVAKTYDMEIHFINVGREDAILIRTNETTIFIDGGLYHQKDVILPYLQALGIKKFDAIIGSHLHNNHIQAQGPIIDSYPVSKVYYGQDLYTCNPKYCNSSGQKYVLDAIKRHNIPQTILKTGDRVTIGDVVIDVYAPITFQTKSQNKYAENYNSLNFILTYGKNKFMFTGDHVQGSEILKKYSASLMNVDLLKYPHHGQATIDKDMVYAMSPQYVIVTNTQIDSLKGYKTYSYLKEFNPQIFYSGRDKHILVKSDGEKITITPNINPANYKR